MTIFETEKELLAHKFICINKEKKLYSARIDALIYLRIEAKHGFAHLVQKPEFSGKKPHTIMIPKPIRTKTDLKNLLNVLILK